MSYKIESLYFAGGSFFKAIINDETYYFRFDDIRSLAGRILPGHILSLGTSASEERKEKVDAFHTALMLHAKSSEIAEAITKVPQQRPNTTGGLKKKPATKKKKPSTKKKTSTKKKSSTKKKPSTKKKTSTKKKKPVTKKKKTSIKKKKTSTKRK
jgi:hypothetical protein